ncbi:DNA-directed RNA polymerase subunit delta [Thermicanus aegyptius]|uniref:DNA-directed RNA polymerase subunit delta n=1 Tax=Thermicanus aegyptius TaxID=94009 RepID=UPI00048FDF20|nr:DNA-directed RNA polymerase subunit delta [Thermicanus aegyptius]
MSELANLNKEELAEMAMVDLAHMILMEGSEPVSFADLARRIQEAKGIGEEEMNAWLVQLYTEMNIDGRFVNIGEGLWGLKKWYPIEQFEEAILTGGRGRHLDQDDDLDDYDDYAEDEDFEDLDDELSEDDELGDLDDEDLGEDLDDVGDEDLLDEADEEFYDDEGLEVDEVFVEEDAEVDLSDEEEQEPDEEARDQEEEDKE